MGSSEPWWTGWLSSMMEVKFCGSCQSNSYYVEVILLQIDPSVIHSGLTLDSNVVCLGQNCEQNFDSWWVALADLCNKRKRM